MNRTARRLLGCLSVWLPVAAFSSTTLTVGELELAGGQGVMVPVEFRSDTSVAAVQMDVLFDPEAYTAAPAAVGSQPASFRVDSHLVEAGRLRVVVGAPNNGALVDGTVFRVPLTAVDEFASFFPVVLTDFALSTAQGTAVTGKIAPRVRLLGLTSGGRVNGADRVQLAVEAGAVDGSVARVEFFVGGQKIGESTTAPFGIVWAPPGSGPFEIQAVAFDSNGLQTASRGVSIVVTNVGTTGIKGLYVGRVRDEPFAFGTAGYVQFATTANGRFSVKLTLGGGTYVQRGRFNEEGMAMVRFNRGRNTPALTLTLQQLTTGLVDQISGQLTDGTLGGAAVENATFVADVLADRSVWRARVHEPAEKGRYTMVFNAAEDAAARKAPLGDGVATASVSKSGAITATFVLSDGTKASQGTFLSKDGHWPLFASLYRKSGVIAGGLNFAEEPGVSDFEGVANWSRPATRRAARFSDGFDSPLAVVGSRYDPPSRSQRVLDLPDGAGNAVFIAEDGGLAEPLERLLTISQRNSVVPLTPDATRLSLKFTPATGLFQGSFIHPLTERRESFTGAVFQAQTLGAGFFLGGELGGGISLEPAPDPVSATQSPPR